MSEPLKKMEIDDWWKIEAEFSREWPSGVSGLYLLVTQQQWMARGVEYGFELYSSSSEGRQGIVAINNKKDFYEVIILCPQADTSKLEDALLTTKIISWSRRIVVPFAPPNIVNCLSRVLPRVGAEFENILVSDSFIYKKNRQPFEFEVPSEYYADRLGLNHVDLVNSTWRHRYESSSWYFTLIMQAGAGYGIFLRQQHTPVSWVFINEAGTLCHLYTLEEHRRRGLGELLLKYVSNVLLGEDKDVFVYCVKENFKACSLYKKLGFQNVSDVTWCYIKPRT